MIIPKNTLLLLLSVVTQWCFIYHQSSLTQWCSIYDISSLLTISHAWMAGSDGSRAYRSSRKTRTIKRMGTSYEEQYTEFSKTEPQGNQQPSLSSPPLLVDNMNVQNFIKNNGKDCEDCSMPKKDDTPSISKEDRETAFLQFISGAPYQSKAIPPLHQHQHQHQQYLHLYKGVSTSLNFSAFSDNIKNKNEDNNNNNDAVTSVITPDEADVAPAVVDDTSTPPDMEIEDVTPAAAAASTSTILDDSASTVEVRVETTFPPGITVERAKYGWLNFCWTNGGGIMITTNTEDKAKKEESEGYINYDEVHDGVPRVRNLMVPIGMKQEIVSIMTSTEDENSNDDKTILRRYIVSYRTVQRGVFCRDFIPYSHKGSVEFIEIILPDSSLPSSSSSSPTITQMIWTVQFQIKRDNESINTDRAVTTPKEKFWAYWSQFQLKIASQNLLAYLNTSTNPVFIEHVEKMPIGVSPREAMEKWYDYYWCRGGGGFTLFVPFLQQNNKKRWIVPSALEEEIISVEYNSRSSSSSSNTNDSNTVTEIAEVIYKVNNPNLLTYPVYYHRATVRFTREKTSENKPTQLIWNVEVQPYRKSLGRGVQFWTESSIKYASRNLRCYLEELQQQSEEERSQQQQQQHKEMRSYLEPTSISPRGVTHKVEDENIVMKPPNEISGDELILPDHLRSRINNANIVIDEPLIDDKDEIDWQ
mmetsp:Transcript_42357/g.47339  ORF Transcript_42357/g.47339 Transcript_42357/m.47339 type:complete len:700 (+) Transcript_42357:92-2191(+)